jgi:hypothetical protein
MHLMSILRTFFIFKSGFSEPRTQNLESRIQNLEYKLSFRIWLKMHQNHQVVLKINIYGNDLTLLPLLL